MKEKIGGRKIDGYNDDGILFHQRPLRSQKHLVVNCSFELKKTKSQLSSISFELFRINQWINTVEYNGDKLNATERNLAYNFLVEKEKSSFKTFAKQLAK